MTNRINTGIVRNGLTFYYDVNNSKSFKGGPTTNSQWNSGSENTPWTNNGGVVTDVTGTSQQGPVKPAKTYRFDKTGSGNQWHGLESTFGGIWTGSSGDIWSTSYWYRTTSTILSYFGVGNFYLADWSRAYNTTVLANVSSVISDGKWHRNYTVVRFDEAYTNAIIADGPSWPYSTSAGTLWLNGIQWEKKPYASSFAAGTRGVTEGLIDLGSAGNSLDLTYTKFNYDGTLLFDGSSSGIKIANSNFNRTNGDSMSVCVWMKSSRSGGQYQDVVVNRSDGLYNWMLYQHTTDGSIQIHGSAQNKSSYIPPIGTWIYLVGTIDGSGNSLLYSNGILQQTVTGYTYYGASPSQLWVGRFGDSNSEPFLGEIPIVQIYDRALTTNEIMQNFQAHRSRFGI